MIKKNTILLLFICLLNIVNTKDFSKNYKKLTNKDFYISEFSFKINDENLPDGLKFSGDKQEKLLTIFIENFNYYKLKEVYKNVLNINVIISEDIKNSIMNGIKYEEKGVNKSYKWSSNNIENYKQFIEIVVTIYPIKNDKYGFLLNLTNYIKDKNNRRKKIDNFGTLIEINIDKDINSIIDTYLHNFVVKPPRMKDLFPFDF